MPVAGPNGVTNAIGYAQFYSRSHDAVIRVYDAAGNVIETLEHKGDFKAGAATAGGAAAGYGIVVATGMTAAGMTGGGAGVGMAAGPVGGAIGAIVGLAAYGLYRIFW